MARYVKMVGTSNPQTNWTTKIVLETGSDGSERRSFRLGEPVQLSQAELSKLESQGFKFEDCSDREVREYFSQTVGAAPANDIVGTGPTFNHSENQ